MRKVRVKEQDLIWKKFVMYEKDEKSEEFLSENVDEFRESESCVLFYGRG